MALEPMPLTKDATFSFMKELAKPYGIVLDCLDGKLNFARKAYEESGLVRDLIDTQKEWIAGHTVREVSDELEELYMR